MPAMTFEFEIEMDDGETFTVPGDQRDMARYEEQDFCDFARSNLTVRYLAYSAAVRAGKIKLSWPQFKDRCVEARDPTAEGRGLDPTQQAASGAV